MIEHRLSSSDMKNTCYHYGGESQIGRNNIQLVPTWSSMAFLHMIKKEYILLKHIVQSLLIQCVK